MSDDSRAELLAGYQEESEEHLKILEEKLVVLEEGNATPQDINEAFRSIHTVKGASGFLGLKTIGMISHVMEDLLGVYRGDINKVTPEGAEALLDGFEKLMTCFDDIDESESVDISEAHDAISKILGGGGSEGGGDEKSESDGITDHPFETLPEGISTAFWVSLEWKDKEASEILDDFTGVGSIIQSVPSEPSEAKEKLDFILDTVLDADMVNTCSDFIKQVHPLGSLAIKKKKTEEAPDAEATETPEEKADVPQDKKADAGKEKKKAKANTSIRIDSEVLSKLINLSGELILSRNQFINKLDGPLLDDFQSMSKQASELQEGLMKTRMQPFSTVTGAFPRLVRTLAKKLDKKVELKTIGDEVELDRNILEGVSAPFTHILRNSLDHGIESPEERKASGKTPMGRITINCFQKGGFVTIEVTDDGKGIDPEKIKGLAIKKGVINEAQAAELTDKQAVSLIYAPGFSTAEQVTDVSGRGVGMDVVKTDFEKMGGTVDLDSRFGYGTTLTVQLPLSVAIIQSLIVKVSKELYAIPRNNIAEVVVLQSAEELKALETLNGTDVLRYRDILLPVVRMADILGSKRTFGEGDDEDRRENIADRRGPDRDEANDRRAIEPTTIIVTSLGEDLFGIVVDGVSHQEETVVKSLNELIKDLDQYMGVTILSSGKVCFILDIHGFTKLSKINFQTKILQQEDPSDQPKHEQHTHENYLVFEFASGEKMGLLAGLVKKTAVVQKSQVMEVKDQFFITHGDIDHRLIFLDQHLKVNPIELGDEFYLIIPKYSDVPFAFVASQVCGISSVPSQLNLVGDVEKGKIGTVVFEEELLNVIDLYALEMEIFKDSMTRKFTNLSGQTSVLVVEDTLVFRKILKGYLDELGVRSEMAVNGKEALDILQANSFDMVISDIEMPVMDGFELVQTIRENPDWNSLPVIALTSLVAEDQKAKGLTMGFNDYLVKTEKNDFIHTIAERLGVEPMSKSSLVSEAERTD